MLRVWFVPSPFPNPHHHLSSSLFRPLKIAFDHEFHITPCPSPQHEIPLGRPWHFVLFFPPVTETPDQDQPEQLPLPQLTKTWVPDEVTVPATSVSVRLAMEIPLVGEVPFWPYAWSTMMP